MLGEHERTRGVVGLGATREGVDANACRLKPLNGPTVGTAIVEGELEIDAIGHDAGLVLNLHLLADAGDEMDRGSVGRVGNLQRLVRNPRLVPWPIVPPGQAEGFEVKDRECASGKSGIGEGEDIAVP